MIVINRSIGSSALKYFGRHIKGVYTHNASYVCTMDKKSALELKVEI